MISTTSQDRDRTIACTRPEWAVAFYSEINVTRAHSAGDAGCYLAMGSPIQLMTVARYYREARPSAREDVAAPTWADVDAAVRRMDNYCFPFVSLSVDNDLYDDRLEAFWIVGGDGQWAMAQSALGGWQYEIPGGGEEEVRLWESDQGYFCKAKNIVKDIDEVLRVTKAFYDSGSYTGLGPVTGV